MNEPLRLAQFLRQRCAQNLYGLCYLDEEQTLLQIPWPVVPKHTGDAPPEFQIYHEWAMLSFQRRGNRDAKERRETPTQEKHRFRNALARANGIVYRKDIKVDGARVYQFIANQSVFDNSSLSSSPPQIDTGKFPNKQHHQTSLYDLDSHWDQNTSTYETYFSINAHSKDSSDVIPRFDQIDIDDLIKITEDPQMPDHSAKHSHDPFSSASLNPNLIFSTQQYSDDFNYLEEQPELEIKVGYRKDDAIRYYVTNKNGCRVFFGKNIPNLSQLLEKEHLDTIMKRFRFKQEYYYGPETLQQIHLPSPCDFMKSPVQKNKTEAILGNMERGLLLYVHYPNCSANVPDIYAKRLCQTRIFLCPDNGKRLSKGFQSIQSLQRMEWTKVFDGNQFCEQLHRVEQSPGNKLAYPSPTFSFSLGQRPSCEERSLLFVCLTVTVQRAHKLLQIKLDQDEEIYISHLTSIDVEAQNLAKNLADSLKIQTTSF